VPLLKKISKNGCLVLGFLVLFITVFLIFSTINYLVVGNVHDFFIPYNIAYALEQGLVLHQDFHSSLGLLYAYLNYIPWLLIKNFPSWFQMGDLIFLSSILFLGLLLVVCLLTRLKTTKKLPNISLSIILIICSLVFQVRNMASFNHKELLWYGVYNHHLWSLLLLQITYVFCWQRYVMAYSEFSINKRDLLILSIIQAVILYLSFNYKITFFLASVCIVMALFFVLARRDRFFYLSLTISLFVLFLSFTALVGYDYLGYLKDITQSLNAKANKQLNEAFLVRQWLYLIAYVLFFNILRVLDITNWRQLSSQVLIGCLRKIVARRNRKYLIFDIFIGLGLLISVIGDYQQPGIYFCLIAAFYIITNIKSKQYKQIFNYLAYGLLIYFFVLNMLGLFRIVKYSESNEGGNKFLMANLDTVVPSLNLPFIIENHIGFYKNYQTFKMEQHPQKADVISNFSYNYTPGYNYNQALVPFYNLDYILGLNEAFNKLKSLGSHADNRLMMLEFVNPLPLFLQAKFPLPAYHWVHLGTTFSYKKVNLLYQAFSNSDFVLMPIISRDGINQTFLNCAFYEWNISQGSPFKVYEITPFMIYFTTVTNLQKYKLIEKNLKSLQANVIEDKCKKVNNLIRKKNKL